MNFNSILKRKTKLDIRVFCFKGRGWGKILDDRKEGADGSRIEDPPAWGRGGGPECMYLPYIQSFVALNFLSPFFARFLVCTEISQFWNWNFFSFGTLYEIWSGTYVNFFKCPRSPPPSISSIRISAYSRVSYLTCFPSNLVQGPFKYCGCGLNFGRLDDGLNAEIAGSASLKTSSWIKNNRCLLTCWFSYLHV